MYQHASSNTHFNSGHPVPLRLTLRYFSLAPLLASVLQLGGDEEVPKPWAAAAWSKTPLWEENPSASSHLAGQ